MSILGFILAIFVIGGILMTVYVGSSKIGKISNGSTSIGKVYKGSELVFQSGPSANMYGLTFSMNNQTFDAYLVGSYSTSGIIVCIPSPTAITKITGTLGASGSKVYFMDYSNTETYYPYLKTTTVNNIKYYDYGNSGGMMGIVVMEKSKAGSYMLSIISNSFKPSSVNSTTVVGGGYTFTRKAANDKTWSLTGMK